MSGEQPKPSDEKRHHLFRLPSQFGQKLRANAFSSSPDKYWTNIANKVHLILAQKYRTGQLKPPTVRRAKIPKVAYLLIGLLVVALPSAFIYAQYSGQFTAQTTVRSPIVVPALQFTIADIWANTTGNYIRDSAFIINTGGTPMTYSFRLYATTTFSNGTQTQDMTRLFLQASVAFNDGSQNLTVASLLSPNQVVSFTYNTSVDTPVRLIFSYQSKDVQLGATSSSLVFSFLYSYSR